MLQSNPDEVKRLTDILKYRSEHEQAVAKTGWDSYQRELVRFSMLEGCRINVWTLPIEKAIDDVHV